MIPKMLILKVMLLQITMWGEEIVGSKVPMPSNFYALINH